MDLKIAILIAAILLSMSLYIILTPPSGDTVPPDVSKPAVFECNSDSDCGLSGFTGFFECRGGSIFGEYLTYMCVDSGVSGLQCAKITSMEFIRNCVGLEECSPGLRDCRQKATTTTTMRVAYSQDLAPLAVTTTTLSDVACIRDSNCGLDHYGKPYCTSSGHSVRDYITYRCVNPGTYSSKCLREKTTYLVDYCGFDQVCISGECVDKRNLEWYCLREDCCATDFSLCGNYSVSFLPFPIRGLYNETYSFEHNTTVYR